jgi:hypothetical protein
MRSPMRGGPWLDAAQEGDGCDSAGEGGGVGIEEEDRAVGGGGELGRATMAYSSLLERTCWWDVSAGDSVTLEQSS